MRYTTEISYKENMHKSEVKEKTEVINTSVFFGGEKGIRTPGTVLAVHTISNRAPSASSDISPNDDLIIITYML